MPDHLQAGIVANLVRAGSVPARTRLPDTMRAARRWHSLPVDTMNGTDQLDRDALRAKYAAERDKRLRADGNDAVRRADGQFAHYLDDPYVAARAA